MKNIKRLFYAIWRVMCKIICTMFHRRVEEKVAALQEKVVTKSFSPINVMIVWNKGHRSKPTCDQPNFKRGKNGKIMFASARNRRKHPAYA